MKTKLVDLREVDLMKDRRDALGVEEPEKPSAFKKAVRFVTVRRR